MLMRVVLVFIVSCALADGACHFHTNDTNDQKLQDNFKKWSIYGQAFTASREGSTYDIGICAPPNKTATSAAILQRETTGGVVLGKLDLVNLVGGDNWLLLTYEDGDLYSNVCDNRTRTATIMFVCGKNSNNITVLQHHTSKDVHCNYIFQFQVPELCPIVPEEKKKMSGGAVFLIIVLCLASAYLIGGILFMRIKRGARGIDQIPNLDSWRKLGHLSADGCDFCCRCNTGASRAGYFLDESGADLRGDDDILAP